MQEAGGSILRQKGGPGFPSCQPTEDWDAEDASEPGRVRTGTVGVGAALPRAGLGAGICLQGAQENLGSGWEPPPQPGWMGRASLENGK